MVFPELLILFEHAGSGRKVEGAAIGHEGRAGERVSLLARLLPPSVYTVERPLDPSADPERPVAEAALVAGMHRNRRASFAAGRACARAALAGLGHPVDALGRLEGGAPDWPPETVGSISHCPDYVAAAVGLARDVSALGIDIEHTARVDLRTVLRMCTQAESQALATRPDQAAVIFSAKESVFKARAAADSTLSTLSDIEIEVVSEAHGEAPGVFAARRVADGAGFDASVHASAGRFLQWGPFTATAVAWTRSP